MYPSELTRVTIEELWDLSALHMAVIQEEQIGDNISNLLQVWENVDIADSRGRTALYWASLLGDAELVDILLDHGANPNAIDCQGSTPLHAFLSRSDFSWSIADSLLASGTNLHVYNNFGNSVLHEAAYAGNTTALLKLLFKGEIDINKKNNRGLTALHIASSYGNVEVSQCLLEAGADVDTRDSTYQRTPLLNAIFNDEDLAIPALLNHNADVAVIDKWGQDLLMLACWKCGIATFDLLSSHGVGKELDPFLVDMNRRTLSTFWIPRYASSRSRFSAFIRLIVSGHCQQCTSDAKKRKPAAKKGCDHGVLHEIGIAKWVDKLYFGLFGEIESESESDFDASDDEHDSRVLEEDEDSSDEYGKESTRDVSENNHKAAVGEQHGTGDAGGRPDDEISDAETEDGYVTAYSDA